MSLSKKNLTPSLNPTSFIKNVIKSFSHSLIRNLKPINTSVRTYATTPKKVTVHPPRRTYLYNQYNDIIKNNRAVFIFQHNNLTVKEFTQIRQEMTLLGGTEACLTVLRPSVFAAALRTTKFLNLEPLLSGPTCILTTNGDEEVMKKSVELLAKNKKLLLLGGKLDEVLLTQSNVLKVVDLPLLESTSCPSGGCG
ncbi:unnamed protein product [Rhizopus stolonifer]